MMVYLILMLYASRWFKATTTEPCGAYTKVNDYQRSTGFKISHSSQYYACDFAWRKGWYRFMSGAGGEMPTSCPDPYSCGSSGSVWLNGTNPSNVEETKTMTACLRYKLSRCLTTWNVTVKKCIEDGKTYFVYYLRRPPGCPMRYCAGNETKCKPNEASPNGFNPGCTSGYPKLKRDPVLSVGVNNETKRIRFKCKFDPQETGDNSHHNITWYQGPSETKIKKEDFIKTGSKMEAYLENDNTYGDAKDPLFNLGQYIYCRVQSYYTSTPWKKSFASNKFFAGFEITPKELSLLEDKKPKFITVTTTVPVVCQEHCRVRLELSENGTDMSYEKCTLNFTTGAAGISQRIKVVANPDWINADKNIHLSFKVSGHLDPFDWNGYKDIPNVLIRTKNIKTKTCQTNGDPRVFTFDGGNFFYRNLGTFMLVKSNARSFEVQVRTFKCESIQSCNCGVAARECNDIVVIDMCHAGTPELRFPRKVVPLEGTSVLRDPNGKHFVINFPSGASVEFQVVEGVFGNIIVKSPSHDNNKTEGLCGNSDGNYSNDLKMSNGSVLNYDPGSTLLPYFVESWRIEPGNSLFDYKEGPLPCPINPKTYCSCNQAGGNNKIGCVPARPQKTEFPQAFRGWSKVKPSDAKNDGRRKRRSISSDKVIVLPDDDGSEIYIYDPEQINGTIDEFPTKTGKTRSNAEHHCTKALKESVAGRACFNIIAGYNINKFVEQCILDV